MPNEMAIRRIFYLGLIAGVFVNLYTLADQNSSSNVRCQFGKILRKQVNAEPLNGTCLRDIVHRLSNDFRSITDKELGLTSFQKILNQMEFMNVSSSLDARLTTLVDKLNGKLSLYAELLNQSNAIIQPILAKKDTRSTYPIVGLDIASNRISDICSQIVAGLAANLKSQEWKNLHVLPVMYPGTMCGPATQAHSIGPLLLSQYCSRKNVLLLVEHGAFMSEGDILLAQITVVTIIDMLSQTDYVNVIGLSSNSSMHCKDSLIKATDINKFQLARYVHDLIRTDSNSTIQVNFKKFMENVQGQVVIIRVTNSLKSTVHTKQINEMISKKLINGYFRTILILSDQEPHTSVKEYLKNNSIIIIPTENILGYEIAKLFSEFKCSQEEKKDFYLSDPYFELYNKTMILSIGQITNRALLSLDIKLTDFLDDITYFNAGPNTYGVLFDVKGAVWAHKDFPRTETMMDQPLKVSFQDIENIHVETVRMMIERSEGVVNVKTKLGMQKWYRWKHLSYTDLIVCLVSNVNEALLPVAKHVPRLPTNILHHRLDLLLHHTVTDNDILCTYQNKLLTLLTGVVYLSPWCLQSPTEQHKLLETGSSVTVQTYMAYIKDLTGLLANPGLHQSVRPDVATLAQVLEYFKNRHTESPLNKFIIRRYIVGTVSGVLEIYPGIVLDSGFDPKRRMWYGKALEHKRNIVFTPPYLDAGGSGYVITMSHTVHRSTERANDYIIAVVSMDVTMGYISRLLKEMFPFCNDFTVKCFLMDDKGYLVSHPALLEPTGKVEQQHLTHKELLVANDILNHELFVRKKSCANYLDGTVQRYYQFNTSLDEVLTNIVHGEHCVKYQVVAVPGTNVFLGVVNVTCSLLRAFCPCSTMDHSCLNCKRMEQTECECPCECSLYSLNCEQHNMYYDLEPCPPLYEQGGNLQSIPWTRPTNLKTCPSFDCKALKTEAECLGIVGCQWCHIDNDGETNLQTPFCSDMSLCFRGVFGAFIPLTDGSYNSQSSEEIAVREWPSVGPVAGGILAFLLILGVMLFCYRLRSVQSGLEHQCLHLHASPDTLRMTHLEGDAEPMDLEQTKNNLDSLIRDGIAPISPYRVSSNYRKPPGGDSDHGYSTMTPHDDSEQQTFAEPLLVVGSNTEPDLRRRSTCLVSPTTHLGSPHHVLAPVTVHCNMETNYC